MYATYAWLPTATTTQVAGDVAAILTGETVVANLSASCNKPDSSITATIPSTWILHDNTSATRKVLKCPSYHNPLLDTYIDIFVSSSTNLEGNVYESYDNVTHIGTNKAVHTLYQRIQLTADGYLKIYCSNKSIVILSEYGSTTGDTRFSPIILTDIVRQAPFYTSTFPSFFIASIGDALADQPNTAYFTKLIDSFGKETSSAFSYGKVTYAKNYPLTKIFGTDVNSHIQASRIMVLSDTTGVLGYIPDMYVASSLAIPPRRDVTIGSDTYTALPAYTSNVLLVKKE